MKTLILAIAFLSLTAFSQKPPAEDPGYRLKSLAGTSWVVTEINQYPQTEDSEWVLMAESGISQQFHFLSDRQMVKYIEVAAKYNILTIPERPYIYTGKFLKIEFSDPEKYVVAKIIEANEIWMEWSYTESGKAVVGIRFRRIR